MFKKLSIGVTVVAALAFLSFYCTSAWAISYSFSRAITGQPGLYGPLVAPNDIAVGPDGKIYIADSSNSFIDILDEFDNFISAIPTDNTLPSGIGVSGNGDVYYVSNFITDNVFKFSSGATSPSLTFGSSGTANGQFESPTGVAVGPDGSVYVADTNNSRIEKFTENGVFVKAWGTQGGGEPTTDPDTCTQSPEFCQPLFQFPTGVAIDPSGQFLLVADTGNDRVQVINVNSVVPFVFAAGSTGSGPLGFNAPSSVAFGPDGSIYVSNTGNNNVQRYGDGFVEFGGSVLNQPHGIAVDKGENVYIADTQNDRIAVFKPDVVVFENGASSKVITGNAPFGATLSINPDAYWNNAPAFELFLWLEAFGQKAYWSSLPLGLVGFSLPSQMKPLASAASGVPAVNNVPLQFLVDSSAVPAGTYTLHLCLDREVNGTFNPSASVCDSIDLIKQ